MTEAPLDNDTDAAEFDCALFLQHLLAVLNEEAPRNVVLAVEAHAQACDDCGALWGIAHETSCREIADFLDDYVEGALPTERREVFDRHLGVCPECVAYLDSYRRSVELARDAESPAPEGVPAALVAAILAAQSAETKRDDDGA